MSIQCNDIIKIIEAFADPFLAEEWDNVGLQVGRRHQMVTKVMLALTPSEQVIQQAIDQRVDMLITHHPLIFKPMKAVTDTSANGRAMMSLIKNDISLYCAHTSLDAAHGGVNDVLAQCLGLIHCDTLAESIIDNSYDKLVLYVPVGYEEVVKQALCEAGAGDTGGNYRCCLFQSKGEGRFKPNDMAQPFIGQVGQENAVAEFRIETMIPHQNVAQVLEAVKQVHPYEEMAYDIWPVGRIKEHAGIGRIGELAQAMTLREFLQRVAWQLTTARMTYHGNLDGVLKSVAVCGGSGASYLLQAKKRGADVLLTGDVKYHDGQLAEELGIMLIDAGHFATEHLILKELAAYLVKMVPTLTNDGVIIANEKDFLQQYHTEY